MRLNDVWRNVNHEISFFTKETFESVPDIPGVYAWFYPLRVNSKDPIEFIKEVNTVLNFDAKIGGKPVIKESFELSWRSIHLNIALMCNEPNLGKLKSIWDDATKNEESFNWLRRCIMKASIFMPPLYVGKAVGLKTRCHQHIHGNDKENNFHRRFTEFAIKNDIPAKNVSDLLFACIRTIEDGKPQLTHLESLVEEVLKHLAKPVYSIK